MNVQEQSSHQQLGPGPVAMEMERLSAHILVGRGIPGVTAAPRVSTGGAE